MVVEERMTLLPGTLRELAVAKENLRLDSHKVVLPVELFNHLMKFGSL